MNKVTISELHARTVQVELLEDNEFWGLKAGTVFWAEIRRKYKGTAFMVNAATHGETVGYSKVFERFEDFKREIRVRGEYVGTLAIEPIDEVVGV